MLNLFNYIFSALVRKMAELSKNQKKLNELSDLGLQFAKVSLDEENGRQTNQDWVNDLLKIISS